MRVDPCDTFIDAIAIANEKTRGFLVREGVDDLLSSPFGVGICSDVEVDNLATIVTKRTGRGK